MTPPLRDFYYYMRLTRSVEERLVSLYRQNQVVGGLYRSLGQEATTIGAAMALEPQDKLAPMIRNLGAYFVRGYRPRDLFMQYMARSGSPTGGRDGNVHFGDVERGIIAPISMLGAMIPVMVGIGWAGQRLGQDLVGLTWIGDGGTSTGEFHEGLGLAAAWKAPVVVIGENNGYAYSTPTSKGLTIGSLCDRALAYGIPSRSIDGNDVVEVWSAVREAAEHARSGRGPFFLEARTFRMRGHAEHDDAKYVPPELLEEWRAKDPIDRLLRDHPMDVSDLDERIAREVEEDAAFAEASPPPDPSFAYGRVFA